MTPELHLFVLWEKVGPSREALLHRIAAEFEILRVFRIRWAPSLFSDNLSRFYGQKLPPGCNKEESCGTGPFTLAVVRDTHPDYAMRDTTRGRARVNARTFDIKAFCRSPAGGCLPIHATDTAREAAHDLALLLGVGPSGFEAAYPGPWDGKILPLRRDISGAQGWGSLDELFAVLNETIDYVVLRNFECLPDRYHLESHGDIDLLVADYAEACLIANAAPAFPDPWRVHRMVVIGGGPVPFDFRYVGDGYYDASWQRRMLESRRFVDSGFFVPDAEDYFYSLLYHAAVHKPAVAADYAERLSELADAIGIALPGDGFFFDRRRLRSFLLEYMSAHGYRFVRPDDLSVHFSKDVALGPIERIAEGILPRKRGAPPASSPRVRPTPVYDLSDERLTGHARVNLLRPFQFGPGQRILELGCEAGTLTRHLGESGADVLAIESVPGLALQAEDRCRDLSNVRIACDDLLTVETEERFDVVMLIGTPDRTVIDEGSGDPIDALIARAAAALEPDGTLILAIDNQLGLKYLNGCPDERTGIPFFGINDLYDQGAPMTVGRRALSKKLGMSGFQDVEFLFPFPDYKLPNLILSERALLDTRLGVADLLIHNAGRAYPENHHRVFAEPLAWQAVVRNGLLPDLANSFLVVARRGSAAPRRIGWLARMYSRGCRLPSYQVETVIVENESGELCVRKRRLFEHLSENSKEAWFRHEIGDSAYFPGEILSRRIHKAMARQAGIEELASCFAPWLKYLADHAAMDGEGQRILPSDFVDCLPDNLIEAPSGELRYFDAEWAGSGPIPFAWTVIRGIVCSLTDCVENRAVGQTTYRELIARIAEMNGISLKEGDFAVADRFEARLVSQYDAAPEKRRRFSEFIDDPIQMVTSLSSPDEDYSRSLAWHRAELARVKSTFSWRITGPLRGIWNFLRRLAKRFR